MDTEAKLKENIKELIVQNHEAAMISSMDSEKIEFYANKIFTLIMFIIKTWMELS